MKRLMWYQSGFTLVELVTVIASLVVIVFWVSLGMANFYFVEDVVLREIKAINPKVEKILITQRGVFSRSRIVVEESNGVQTTYLLDSNILFNYSFERK